MADDSDVKRLNILVPIELFNKFQDFSQKEYKNTTSMIIEWMVQYVSEKEKAQNRTKNFMNASLKLNSLIERIARSQYFEEQSKTLAEINVLWSKLLKDITISDSPEFLADLIAVARKIPEPDIMDDVPF